MSEFMKRGHECGLKCASDNYKEIRKCKTNITISDLAADRMERYIQISKDWWCNEPEWRVGFWDAFMSRADEIREDIK